MKIGQIQTHTSRSAPHSLCLDLVIGPALLRKPVGARGMAGLWALFGLHGTGGRPVQYTCTGSQCVQRLCAHRVHVYVQGLCACVQFMCVQGLCVCSVCVPTWSMNVQGLCACALCRSVSVCVRRVCVHRVHVCAGAGLASTSSGHPQPYQASPYCSCGGACRPHLGMQRKDTDRLLLLP